MTFSRSGETRLDRPILFGLPAALTAHFCRRPNGSAQRLLDPSPDRVSPRRGQASSLVFKPLFEQVDRHPPGDEGPFVAPAPGRPRLVRRRPPLQAACRLQHLKLTTLPIHQTQPHLIGPFDTCARPRKPTAGRSDKRRDCRKSPIPLAIAVFIQSRGQESPRERLKVVDALHRVCLGKNVLQPAFRLPPSVLAKRLAPHDRADTLGQPSRPLEFLPPRIRCRPEASPVRMPL